MDKTRSTVTIDLFNDEERQVINQLAEGTGYGAGQGEIYKAAVNFRNLMDEGNEDFKALADALCSKLHGISDSEWDELKQFLPFPVNIAITQDYVEEEIPDEET